MKTNDLIYSINQPQNMEQVLRQIKLISVYLITTHMYADTETLVLWPSDAKGWLIGKDPDVGENWGFKKGVTEDKMVG